MKMSLDHHKKQPALSSLPKGSSNCIMRKTPSLTAPAAQSLSTADVDSIESCSTVSAKKKSAKTKPMNEKKDLNAPKRGKNMFNYYISENLV
jgi:hypothetical protein